MRFERPVDLAAMLLVRFFSRTSNASAMTVSARAISRRFSQVGNETKSSAACWLTRKRYATHRFDAPATRRCADLYLSSKSEPSSRKPMIDINGMTDVILTVSRYDKATAFCARLLSRRRRQSRRAATQDGRAYRHPVVGGPLGARILLCPVRRPDGIRLEVNHCRTRRAGGKHEKPGQ